MKKDGNLMNYDAKMCNNPFKNVLYPATNIVCR